MTLKGTVASPRFDETVIGQQFGLDTILGASFRLRIGLPGKEQTHRFVVVARGEEIRVVRLNALRAKNPETSTSNLARHKLEHTSWRAMLERCNNQSHDSAERYSERGITVCERWRTSFAAFFENMGPRKANESIEHIDNDAGYFKDNCRWATRAEQSRNKCSNIWFERDGVRLCLQDWCNRLGLDHRMVRMRLQRGHSIEHALLVPVRRARVITLDGVSRTVSEWAKLLGVRCQLIDNRLRKKGYSERDAVFGKRSSKNDFIAAEHPHRLAAGRETSQT